VTEKDRETILIVSTEVEISTLLSETLTGDGRFYAEQATSFYDALDKIVTGNFSLVLVDNKLPDMTGLDLLTATARLVPDLPMIVIDRELSARAALAAFRLGAADYIARPFQPDMLLMQVIRILRRESQREAVGESSEATHAQPAYNNELPELVQTDELSLNKSQNMAIHGQLTQFHTQVRGSFAALLDSNNQIVASAGSLKNVDMELVKDALTVNKAKRLAHALDERSFNANYLEGEFYNVYSIEFGDLHKISLVAICESNVKSGVVLFFAKQAAETINEIVHREVPVPG